LDPLRPGVPVPDPTRVADRADLDATQLQSRASALRRGGSEAHHMEER
jgi:hypothetical protein